MRAFLGERRRQHRTQRDDGGGRVRPDRGPAGTPSGPRPVRARETGAQLPWSSSSLITSSGAEMSSSSPWLLNVMVPSSSSPPDSSSG